MQPGHRCEVFLTSRGGGHLWRHVGGVSLRVVGLHGEEVLSVGGEVGNCDPVRCPPGHLHHLHERGKGGDEKG